MSDRRNTRRVSGRVPGRRKSGIDENSLMKATLQNTGTIQGLGAFARVLVPPTVSHREVVVLYADVRGFTDYCYKLQQQGSNKKIHNFLMALFPVFANGLLMHLISNARELPRKRGREAGEVTEVSRLLMPSSWKTLGDGMLMVWELDGATSSRVAGQVSKDIWLLASAMSDFFSFQFRNLTSHEKDAYSDRVTELKLAFGLARGHALRLDFPGGSLPDYAGNVMNLGARLVDFARPEGTVAQYDVAPGLFEWTAKHRNGMVRLIKGVKGFPEGVKVWLSPEVVLPDSALPR
jgi:class 3 adenylate cyclase